MLKSTAVETAVGHVWFSSEPLADGPAVLLIHGAMRTTDEMQPVARRLRNCVFGHLPAHGVPALEGANLDLWSRAFATAASAYFRGRPVVLAGESLGALVCLGMARFPVPGLLSVVAVEPPLSFSWPLEAAALPAWLKDMLRDDHRPLLASSRIPVTVVAGDAPLHPPRPLASTPSLLSDEDRQGVASLEVLAGGHQLMTENPEGCAAIVRRHLAQYAGVQAD
ncbi:MAG: alpha/beta fold hydrolase [Pseudomonadota bacterium]